MTNPLPGEPGRTADAAAVRPYAEPLSRWPLRVLAVIIAGSIWLVASFLPRVQQQRSPESERELDVAVTWSLPPGFVITNPNQTVRVKLRGRQDSLRYLTSDDIGLRVPFGAATEPGAQNVTLGIDNVVVALEGVTVVSLLPNLLNVLVDREETRTMRVDPDIEGEPSAGAELIGHAVIPEEVVVRGPANNLSRLRSVTTEPVNLDTHVYTFNDVVAVLSIDPAVTIVEPRTVNVVITLKPPPGLAGSPPAPGTQP